MLFDDVATEPARPCAHAPVPRGVQPVFQDPYSSLDPRQRIDRIVGEPLRSLRLATGSDARARVAEALASVGLAADTLTRYPHEFSGGQRQRIAIARAIVSRPRVLLADEPVSALDVTTRVQVIDLLARLRREHGLTLVMVSHDLGAVAAVCERTGGAAIGPRRRVGGDAHAAGRSRHRVRPRARGLPSRAFRALRPGSERFRPLLQT